MNAPESAKLYDPGLESTGERADLLASSGDDAPKTQIIAIYGKGGIGKSFTCLLYTSPSPRDGLLSRMPSSA